MRKICRAIVIIIPVGMMVACLYLLIFMIPRTHQRLEGVPSEDVSSKVKLVCPEEVTGLMLDEITDRIGFAPKLTEIESLRDWANSLKDQCEKEAANSWLDSRAKDAIYRLNKKAYAKEHPVEAAQ